MDTIEQLCQEIRQLLADITASGFNSTAESTIIKLEEISSAAVKLDLKIGKGLIDNFLTALKAYQAGTVDERSVSVRFSALDFYEKNLLGSVGESEIEEL
jgi:hypothetical protein